MALTGTVIRITTRGSKGKKRKQHLIVVPGQGAGTPRMYRIRDYPEGTKGGDIVSFEDLGVRIGGYWEAKIPGYRDAKPASKLSPLEREVRNYPNLAPERASNVISGLSMLVDAIKTGWHHIDTGWRKGTYERPFGRVHPFEKYIAPYVEVESPTWNDKETAIKDYKAILYALTGRAVETRRRESMRDPYSLWGATREVWRERSPEQTLDFLRDEIRDVFTRSVMAETLQRFEKWVSRQRNKFGYS